MATILEQAQQEKSRRDIVRQAEVEKQDRQQQQLLSQAEQALQQAGPRRPRPHAGLPGEIVTSVPTPSEEPEFVPPTIPPRQFRGFADEFIRALGRGSLNVGSSLLSAFADVAQESVFDVDRINDLAEKAREASREPKFQPASDGKVKGFIANAIGDAIPFMAGTIAAVLVGGPAAGFSVAYAVEGKNAYFDALETGATESQAEMEGMIVGSINAALELLQVKQVVKFAKVGKGSLKEIAKSAKKKALKQIIQQGKNLSKEAVKLAITEGVQESLQETTAVLAPLITGRELQEKGKLRRIGQAGLGGAVAGVALGGAGRAAVNIATRNDTVTPAKPSPKPEDISPTPPEVTEQVIIEQSKDKPVVPTENNQVNRQLIEKKIALVQVDEESNNAVNLLDKFIGQRQLEEQRANVNTLNKQESIAKAVGEVRYKKQSQVMDEAVQVYIDLQNNPAQMKFFDKLTNAQKEVVTLAQNLPSDIKQIADQIITENRQMGKQAQQNNIIKQALDVYSARIWQEEPPARQEFLKRKFGTKTSRARARTLEGILHGWSIGKKLRVKTATGAQNAAQIQVATTIVDRETLKLARKWGLISDKQPEGWVPVEHPNFADWRYAGEDVVGETYGQNFFVTENGTILERRRLYATPELGKSLNKILATPNLKGVLAVIDEWNTAIKQTILYTSFFHHQAYIRSYVGGGRTGIKGLNVAQAYRDGRQAVMNFETDLKDLVFAGLTIGRVQDIDESVIKRFDNVWDRVAKALGKEDVGAFQVLRNIRDKQTDFLFKRLGPYLKVQTALLEYRHELNKQKSRIESGATTRREVADNVANLINDDFGGLNLQRLGIDPRTWQIARFLMLAPDWTISNVRTMTKAFKAGDQGAMYRAFWGRVLGKLLGATVLWNVIMAALDDDNAWERYQKAWKAGNLRWLDVDVTPIYRALGGREDRKYFSVLGHFRDPLKFLVHPFRSAKHKGSVLTRMSLDVASGQDWRGREFTSVTELFGGEGITKFTVGGAGVLEPTQILSFLVYELGGTQPIQIQNAVGFLLGEVDAFDALTKSAGLMTGSVKEQLQETEGRRLRSVRKKKTR
ncbi:hypothetical protein LCGC14_1282050 [marine sediment metagenome]|uniref:Large polyvalent protein associated domain-containing protein n=1 Tax=marine sediment metagenome TaxID=412755 RepID=A0A0F9NY01_9ZZZZ